MSPLAVVLAILPLVWLVLDIAPARADDVIVKSYQIAAQSLSTALKQFAAQSNMQVIFSESDVGQTKTIGIHGNLPPREALNAILKGTDLEFEFTANNVIVVTKAGSRAATRTSGFRRTSDRRLVDPDPSSPGSGPGLDGTLAQSRGPTGNEVKQQQENPKNIEEIVVTAQKRYERLQDTPVPVSVINTQALAENNQLLLRDYFSSVPGVSFTQNAGSALGTVVLRGLSTGPSAVGVGFAPTTAYLVDDAPYGGSSSLTGTYAPDIDPGDIERIEVLRGPQGTLYGASSLGGLVKFVTVQPSTAAISGQMQAGVSSVYNGNAPGYNVRGSVNVPLSETLAVRASGFTREDPGYIDDPFQGLKGVNKSTVYGGHLSALWSPSTDFTLKLSALSQEIRTDGTPNVYVEPGLSGLEENAPRGWVYLHRINNAFSATANATLGSVNLTSVTGYNQDRNSSSYDYSFPLYVSIAQSVFPGANATPVVLNYETSTFTQEFRLAGSIASRVDWLFGAFYDYSHVPDVFQNLVGVDLLTGSLKGSLLQINRLGTYAEVAGFGDLTFHITDQFNIQIGGREGTNRQVQKETEGGALTGGPVVVPSIWSKDSAFTYLFTPQYRFSTDLMVYARLASGYQPGGPNSQGAYTANAPASFKPSTTRDYEIGLKGDLLDRTVAVDLSLYYIDWKDLQVQEFENGFGFVTNASRAKSDGVEFSLEWRPVTGMKIAGWAAWNDARLTQSFPPASTTVGASGDRLPYSSIYSGQISIDQEFHLTGRLKGFVGASESYVGNRVGVFQSTPDRQYLPAYAKADFRTGLLYDSWKVNLYVTNAFDERGLLVGGQDSFPMATYEYITPRTVGINVIRTF